MITSIVLARFDWIDPDLIFAAFGLRRKRPGSKFRGLGVEAGWFRAFGGEKIVEDGEKWSKFRVTDLMTLKIALAISGRG